MEQQPIDSDLLYRQYGVARDEIQKSIFVQYDVIKIGTTFLSALLVAVPTSYAALTIANPLFLSLTMIGLAFISMSFVFIMGAGEIRIMRAASFSTKLLSSLFTSYQPLQDQELVWDHFVARWNQELYGKDKEWKYQERIYLAMPFIIIAVLADIGGLSAFYVWISSRSISTLETCCLVLVILSMAVQIWLYNWPARLSKELARASAGVKPHNK
jgi:hypothetical protein